LNLDQYYVKMTSQWVRPAFLISGTMTAERDIQGQVEEVLAPILRDEGLDLVEIEFKPSSKRWLLRIYIDKAGGVTISDCEYINRELGRILDVEDFITHPYTLEVSSPGLTRPLKRQEDFERYKGRFCRVITREKVQGKNEFEGEIIGTDGDDVEIRGKIGIFRIPMCAIRKAHLQYEL
jgi:ribosome maturation factor RimP